MFLKYSIVHIIIATAFDEFDFYYRYDFQSTFFINIFYCLQYQYSFSSFTRLLLALYILIDLVDNRSSTSSISMKLIVCYNA